jgi:hypothetical protein
LLSNVTPVPVPPPEPGPAATAFIGIVHQPIVTTVTADDRGTKRQEPSSSSEQHILPPEPANSIGHGLSNGSENAEEVAQAGTKRKAVPTISNQKGNISTISNVHWKEGLDRDLNETQGTVRVGVQSTLLLPLAPVPAPVPPNGFTNTEGIEHTDTSNHNGDISTISNVHWNMGSLHRDLNETQGNHGTMHAGVQSSLLSPGVTAAPSTTEFTSTVHHQPIVGTGTADARSTKRQKPSSISSDQQQSVQIFAPLVSVNGIGNWPSNNGSTNTAEGVELQTGTKRKAAPISSERNGNIPMISSSVQHWKEGLRHDLNEKGPEFVMREMNDVLVSYGVEVVVSTRKKPKH